MHVCPTWVPGLVKVLLIFSQCSIVPSEDNKSKQHDAIEDRESSIEVRAVFLNCEAGQEESNPSGVEDEVVRFQRQELFKHNALKECNKKLALSVKMATVPDNFYKSSRNVVDDEYIPIDHVLDGPDRKRVRLLNPYIMRLRRQSPRQAYKLRRIQAVSGILTNLRPTLKDHGKSRKQSRLRREMEASYSDDFALMLGSAASVFTLEHENPGKGSYSVRIGRLQELIKPHTTAVDFNTQVSKDCGLKLFNVPLANEPQMTTTEAIQKDHDRKNNQLNYSMIEKSYVCPLSNDTLVREKRHRNDYLVERPNKSTMHTRRNKHHISESRPHNRHTSTEATEEDDSNEDNIEENYSEETERKTYKSLRPERNYMLYEIGMPSLWFGVDVQMYEKMYTSEGNTLWNDLTRGHEAKVSSLDPEWKSPDLNVRYRPADWIAREEFTLPSTKLCLLEPLKNNNNSSYEKESENDVSDFIVVPLKDVIGLTEGFSLDRNDSKVRSKLGERHEINEPLPHRVEVRLFRALFANKRFKLSIATFGDSQFLTLPHHRPHRAQIDLELRGDDNELVRVGTSGRLSTVVSDSSRKARTILTLQATNTGLASARFTVRARDCGPELTTLMSERGTEELSTGPVVLPPHHTRRLQINLPVEIPVDSTHCNVALVNDNNEAVAVREVAIKRGDRCFCVWHCECVCLSEDPRLLCREMLTPQQTAAGLAPSERSRSARSCSCVKQVVVGVWDCLAALITVLLLLGLIKALLGLKYRSIGQAGIHHMLIRQPPYLDDYYELDFCEEDVKCDEEGWPVHPYTGERTVMLVSKKREFFYNIFLYVGMPFVMLIRRLLFAMCRIKSCFQTRGVMSHDVRYSSQQDIQNVEVFLRLRKQRQLRDWMTPAAEKLATDILQEGLGPQRTVKQTELQPLLHETSLLSKSEAPSVLDSEQDDTDYVIAQMQKSRESLARSQKKVNDSGLSSGRYQTKCDNK